MRRKLRDVRLILTEIVIVALGVMCCIMPMPWRLVVPIIIGTRSVLMKAHMRIKERKLAESTADIPKDGKGKKSNAKKDSRNQKAAGKTGGNKAARRGGEKEKVRNQKNIQDNGRKFKRQAQNKKAT